MNRRQRPQRRPASPRAARRRRGRHATPERLPTALGAALARGAVAEGGDPEIEGAAYLELELWKEAR